MFSADLGGAAPASAPAATDPPFQKVALLLHGDGTNGAQNNTFLDSSTNNFTITRTGNVAQGTFSPFSLAEGQWSNYFDGTGDYLSVPRSTSFFPVANEDFTIEAWVYLTATPSSTMAWVIGAGEYGTDSDFVLTINSSLQCFFYLNSNFTSYINTTNLLTLNTWNHVAVSRYGTSSNNLKVFVNGVGQSFTTYATTVATGNRNLTIGADQNGDESNLTGYISNLRIVKGTAVYTSNFTPPTSALTAISGTSLLTCQSNRFKDNSSNNFTITRNGDTKVTAFSPFAPSAAYSASTNGGSGYFDGSGDYLTASGNLNISTSSFTIEAWVYTADPTFNFKCWFSASNGGTGGGTGWGITYQNGYIQLMDWGGGYLVRDTDVFPWNQWVHVAFVRDAGTLKLYVNGVLKSSYSGAWDWPTASGHTYVGNFFGSYFPYTGYLSNLRVVVGSAVYSGSSFTVPTAPLTAVANTQLLLNCTNAGIIDNSGKNDIETVGNAQISTSVKKYGTGSMYFDGNNDYLTIPSSPNLSFGTGDFTIEGWFYLNENRTVSQNIIDFRTAEPAVAPYLYVEASTAPTSANQLIYYVNGSSRIASTSAPSLSTWYLFAVSRQSGVTKMFINGTQAGSNYTDTNNYTSSTCVIGGRFAAVSGDYRSLNGYIDDLRITKGQALYTSNFTPPTQAFPNV